MTNTNTHPAPPAVEIDEGSDGVAGTAKSHKDAKESAKENDALGVDGKEADRG